MHRLTQILEIAIFCLFVACAFGKENSEATKSYEKALAQLKSGDLST